MPSARETEAMCTEGVQCPGTLPGYYRPPSYSPHGRSVQKQWIRQAPMASKRHLETSRQGTTTGDAPHLGRPWDGNGSLCHHPSNAELGDRGTLTLGKGLNLGNELLVLLKVFTLKLPRPLTRVQAEGRGQQYRGHRTFTEVGCLACHILQREHRWSRTWR